MELEQNIFNEAYYGRLPEFDKMVKLMDTIIKKVNKDPKKANPNKYPENKKLEALFEKVFGFKRTYIYWEPYIYANSYTIPLNTLIIFGDRKKYIESDIKKGWYDPTHTSILTVYSSIGLISHTKLTAEELIAVILHETGHNFDYGGYHYVRWTLDLINSSGLSGLETLIYRNDDSYIKHHYYDQISTSDDKIYNDQKMRDLINAEFNDKLYRKMEKKKASIIRILLRGLIGIPISVIFSPLTQLSIFSSKQGEKFADSFATSYGFGLYLNTALNKLGDYSKYWKPETGSQKFLYRLGKFQLDVLQVLNDPHPLNKNRCKKSLENLKKDLKANDFPPEMKKDLTNDINKLTDIYNKLYTKTPEEQKKTIQMNRKLCTTVFNGIPGLGKLFK